MLNFLWNALFPKKCLGCRKIGSYLCPDCFATLSFAQNYFCGICQRPSYNGLTHPKCRTRFGIDGIFPILNYKGLLKKVLYQYKYRPYLSDLAPFLGELLYEGIIQNEIIMREIENEKCLICAVPLHPSRQRERGYNQAQLLASHLSKKTKIPIISGVLSRTKKTVPQFMLPKEKRRENIHNAFTINKRNAEKIHGKVLFLIDDITTTGTTLSECARVLKRNGAVKVYGIALAHEEK